MIIYLAGRYGDLPVLRDVAYLLLMAGHSVSSRWLNGDTPDPQEESLRKEIAESCTGDIVACDIFVLYNRPEPVLRQGHSVELGLALGMRLMRRGTAKPDIIIVGHRTDNVFHYAAGVRHIPDLQSWLHQLSVPGRLLHEPMISEAVTPSVRSIDATQIA